MRRIPLLVVLGLLTFEVLATTLEGAEQPWTTWSVYGGDFEGTKYSALDQIHRANVRQLVVAWEFSTGDLERGRAGTIECNPLVVNDVVYLTTATLRVHALRGDTGELLWTFDPDNGANRHANRGLSYWTDGAEARLFVVMGSYLHAIDAQSGTAIPSFGADGKVNLREGLDRDVFSLSVSATTPGIVFEDRLILGSRVGEGPGPSAPGHIRAFNVRTGEREWIFNTIPHPEEYGYDTWSPDSWKSVGGANSWAGFTLDQERGMVFAGTGSAAYDHWGGDRIGENLFANCVLALNARTGERLWHFQTVHHDLWDYDVACPPNLVTIEKDGALIDAVAQATKTGMLFVLDRETGTPLFPVEERPVPQSTIPGEESWPTQPFPTKPKPYAQQRFTMDEVARLNPNSTRAIEERLAEMTLGDVYLPPALKPAVTLPQFNGGTDWGGAAFDPTTRTLFVNSSSEAEWISMVAAKPKASATYREFGQQLYNTICSNCHGMGAKVVANAPALASLQTISERMSRTEVAALLQTGRGQMPAFSFFSEVEKDAVLAFLFGGESANERIDLQELELNWPGSVPYVATGHHNFRDPEGFPVNERPWGTLTAIDLDSGDFRWQIPLGTYPKLEARGYPPTGTFNMGGPVVTAGGLVFIGASMDERFHAYDVETGETLWEYQLPAGAYATPATYAIGDRQYVIIAAAGAGKPGTKVGDRYLCFALPESN